MSTKAANFYRAMPNLFFISIILFVPVFAREKINKLGSWNSCGKLRFLLFLGNVLFSYLSLSGESDHACFMNGTHHAENRAFFRSARLCQSTLELAPPCKD